MEQVTGIAGLCVMAAILAVMLKKGSPEVGMLLSLAAVAVGGGLLLRAAEEAVAFLRQMIAAGGLLPELFAPLLKTVAIALVSRFGSDLCRDAGENALASLVEMAGSFGTVLVSLPLLTAVWEMLQVLR